MLVVRHWLLSTLFVLTVLVAYTESPLYGAEPTPTPNVSTVPKPGQFVTPTATPLPVIVIITQAAPSGTSPGTSLDVVAESETPNAPGNSSNATPAAQPALDVPYSNATADQPVVGSSRPNHRAASVISTDGTRLVLAVEPSQTLIWPGVLFQLHMVVSNRGDGALTNLEVRQPLSSALRYHATATNQATNQTIDQAGSIQVEQTVDQGAVLVMRWPHLAQGAVVSGTVALQVKNDTPNGIFLDTHVVAQSAEGATATVALTLVMPPTILPQFRWDQREK